MFNCCPLGDVEWRLNISKLLEYSSVFTGTRVVLVRTGSGLASVGSVKDAFKGFQAAFVPVPNSTLMGEVPGWVEALEGLYSVREDEATFYAHTKGVSYDGLEPQFLQGVRVWRDTMYTKCLSEPTVIDRLLSTNAFVGTYKRRTRAHGFPSWHYAGTFWWFKHARFFGNPAWKSLGTTRFAVEQYPGRHFGYDEAHCLYNPFKEDLYATTAKFTCTSCTHQMTAVVKRKLPRARVCSRCHKTTSYFSSLMTT